MTWNPLTEQYVEPDTLFLLNPVSESTFTPGFGGLMDANTNGSPWEPNPDVAEVPGKYRTGLQSTNRAGGYAWMPFDGWLPSDQFTVEFWLNSPSVPWSQIADNTPLAFNEDYSDGIWVTINAGWLMLRFIHEQSASGPVSTGVRYNVANIPTNQWENFAFTYASGTLTLYVNGVVAGSATNVPAPQIWTGSLDLGGVNGKGATSLQISDLRISRTARVPGQTLTVSNANDVTVDPSEPTGQTVNQDLLGGLHTLGSPATEAMAQGVLKDMRTDKLLTATPIVAGAPDATHPSQGVSGAFSYDWQVVDRTFAYYARLGLTPYISIDSTPQILGGTVPPYSGTALTTERSYESGFSSQVPSSLSEWSEIVKDLVYHVTVEDHYSVPYWGVWNEPDGSSFWSGTLNDYLALYQATVTAVKSVNPSLQVGGPETASWNPTWIQGLINYCAANHLPLDFISWHYYSGDLGEIAEARAEVAQWAQAAGIPTPKLLIGEWAGNARELPGSGDQPWSSTNVFLNDSHATFVAQALMLMQADGVAKAFYTNPVAEANGLGWNGTGLMSSTEPWSNLNVFRMWSMLEPTIVAATYSGQPGVLVQASTGDAGTVTLLLAYNRYRKDLNAPTAVHLPTAYAGWTVQDYVMDDQHSDAWDAGPAHANLEQLPESTVDSTGTTHTTLLPDSVDLLVISPPTA